VSLRHHESLPGRSGSVHVLLTDRRGGHSAAPYDGANLGGHVGDDPAAVAANRQDLAALAGVEPDRLIFMNQVHGAEVVELSGPWPGDPPEADAMVTREPDLALAVLVADCIPVLLADADEGIIGVAHAGRPGLAAGVAVRAVEAMRELGATSITARLGPCVCPRCYEVPDAMRADVAAIAPLAASLDRRGRPAIDIAAGVLDQLVSLGVDVLQLPGCTRESPELFSHRREGVTGRFAGVVVRPSPQRSPGSP
jgi:YfiH family protein